MTAVNICWFCLPNLFTFLLVKHVIFSGSMTWPHPSPISSCFWFWRKTLLLILHLKWVKDTSQTFQSQFSQFISVSIIYQPVYCTSLSSGFHYGDKMQRWVSLWPYPTCPSVTCGNLPVIGENETNKEESRTHSISHSVNQSFIQLTWILYLSQASCRYSKYFKKHKK